MVTPGPAHPLWAPSVSVFSTQHPPRWFVLYAQGLPQLSFLSFWIRTLLLQSLASLQNHKIGPDDASSVWELGFSLKASLFWWCSLPDYYIVIFFTGILKSTPLAILLRMPTQWLHIYLMSSGSLSVLLGFISSRTSFRPAPIRALVVNSSLCPHKALVLLQSSIVLVCTRTVMRPKGEIPQENSMREHIYDRVFLNPC